MPKILQTAQVEDVAKWEEGFRTHGDIMRNATMSGPIGIGSEGNVIAVCFEVENLDTFREVLSSPAVAGAMATDGLNADTLKTFVLDREFTP